MTFRGAPSAHKSRDSVSDSFFLNTCQHQREVHVRSQSIYIYIHIHASRTPVVHESQRYRSRLEPCVDQSGCQLSASHAVRTRFSKIVLSLMSTSETNPKPPRTPLYEASCLHHPSCADKLMPVHPMMPRISVPIPVFYCFAIPCLAAACFDPLPELFRPDVLDCRPLSSERCHQLPSTTMT